MASLLHISFEVAADRPPLADLQMERVLTEVFKISLPFLGSIQEEVRLYGCELREEINATAN